MNTIDLAALVGCETGRAVIVVRRSADTAIEVRVPKSRVSAVAVRLSQCLPLGVGVDVKSLGHEEQYTQNSFARQRPIEEHPMNNECRSYTQTFKKLHADIQEAAKALLFEVPAKPIPWSDKPIFCNRMVMDAYDRVRAEGYKFQYPVVVVNRMPRNPR